MGSLCCVVGFVAYWRGVHATEQRIKPLLAARAEYIEELLDDRRAMLAAIREST
jgi:hypothetical protein